MNLFFTPEMNIRAPHERRCGPPRGADGAATDPDRHTPGCFGIALPLLAIAAELAVYAAVILAAVWGWS